VTVTMWAESLERLGDAEAARQRPGGSIPPAWQPVADEYVQALNTGSVRELARGRGLTTSERS
jgi:hypothetical protein